jgi:putative transcriptional regulator
MSSELTSLNNQLLIAMPSLLDPAFGKTVVYVCEHNSQGAVGLIINRPLNYQLSYVFDQMDIKATSSSSQEKPLMFGGPIQPERGFVIHRPMGVWRSSLNIDDDVTVTTSNDIIHAIANGSGPQDALVTLGYAGWAENQLEQEVVDNSWLVCPFSPKILYNTPFERRWEVAAEILGVNIHFISSGEGHA